MLMSEYMALMNLMRILGFKQNPKELTKFYITCNGDIKAQVVDEPDEKYRFISLIEVKLASNEIQFKYHKYAALENGRLTWINCQRTAKFSVHEFLMEYSQILNEIYDSPVYEFTSINYYEKTYDPRTAMEIIVKSIEANDKN